MNASTTQLHEQQNLLLAHILSAQVNAPTRGLAAYRANAHASAERALSATYPVLSQLMGNDNFAYLARDFWHRHPPLQGDLAQWGATLPLFLADSVQLADTPYLADVARLEWALHTCAGAADKAQDLASFACLTQLEPDQIYLSLSPGARVLQSPYPAVSMTLAHMNLGTLQDAATLLSAGGGQAGLVWRQGFAPRLRVLPVTELSFTQALCAGHSLGTALDLTTADFDFTAWLPEQVQSGFILGAALRTEI
jgi:Putative DNA-binding domain